MDFDKEKEELNEGQNLNQIIYVNDDIIDESILFKILTNQNIFNTKKTKIILKENYEYILKLINRTKEDELISFLNYLNKVNIPILKILINSFIEFDLEEDNIKKILNIISKVIVIFYNRNIFHFIYKKLSKYFRRHDKLSDIQTIKKFEKLFQVWKLLYNLDILSSPYQNVENTSITFFSDLNNNDNINIKIDIPKPKNGTNSFYITINFICSPILNINKFIENFYFLKVFDVNKKEFKFKYSDIFIEDINNKNKSFSKIKKISFHLQFSSYKININDKEEAIEKKTEFNFDLISQIIILNNFFGEISSIIIERENLFLDEYQIKKKLKIEIKKDSNYDKVIFDKNLINDNNMNPNLEEIEEEDPINYSGEIFSKELEKNINYNYWKRRINDLSEIEYFGGFECFIPLFRIIKYILTNLQNIFKNNENNKNEYNDYINKSLEMTLDILKIIVKLICISKKNFTHFKKIIVPLICSLSEIIQILEELSISNLDQYKSFFFRNELIFILYIIIINSQIPNNIYEIYYKIFEIKNNKDNYDLSFDFIIFDLEKIKIKNLYWYFLILFNFIISILIYYDLKKNIPKKLVEQLDLIYAQLNMKQDKNMDVDDYVVLKPFINFVKVYCLNEEENRFLEFYEILQNKYIYLKYIINFIKTFLNIKKLLEIDETYFDNNFILKVKQLLYSIKFDEICNDNSNEIFKDIKYYYYDYENIIKIFPFLKDNNFINEDIILINDLIDYHGLYHNLMRELFVFNRFWSNKKLFYNDTINKRKESNLKYKNINYYTKNFQRPIIYPVLDYKYRYPIFSKFKFEKKLYNEKETEDDYNFDLDCSNLDKLIEEYNHKIFKKIEENKDINIYKICLIKQAYHIKGKLFIINSKNNLILVFYNYLCDLENKSTCNKIKNIDNKKTNFQQNKRDDLCYGSLFETLKKEKNKKIQINFNNIRMILKRIYHYRKSALEIFTETKSYYFNFYNENELNKIMNIFKTHCENIFFPITVNDNLFGYIRINQKIIKEIDYKKSHNFFNFISQKINKGELGKMSIFDSIIIINLISNRSYIDLHQYPIFPLLFFYDKNHNEIERNFKEHIGFQTKTEEGKKRKSSFKILYKSNKEEKEEDNDPDKNIYYFNTHYSNIVYTSNYMIRLFPYTFCCIELQGDSFDNPNRLFFSIEETFYNISVQKSDLRELIPEFFYLPEMFMNINSIFFDKTSKGELVDDVIMPNYNQNNKEFLNIINKNEENLNYFIFVDNLKNKLEHLRNDFVHWINLIFGEYQRYNSKHKHLQKQYFRTESYIDINEETYKKYSNDEEIMISVEYGLIPLQTIFEPKILSNFENKKNSYEKLEEITKNKNNKKTKKEQININNNNLEEDLDFWDKNFDFEIKINNNDSYGIVEIYDNKNDLITEIIDHNDKILNYMYNKRLNIFATTSLDGYICAYILPNKLFSIIKHPNNLYFENVYLSANPFPTIIAFDKNDNTLRSYSLSGILIKEKKVAEPEIKIQIKIIFDEFGGTFKDGILIYDESNKLLQSLYMPFFDNISK